MEIGDSPQPNLYDQISNGSVNAGLNADSDSEFCVSGSVALGQLDRRTASLDFARLCQVEAKLGGKHGGA